jgi:hypothetical protein
MRRRAVQNHQQKRKIMAKSSRLIRCSDGSIHAWDDFVANCEGKQVVVFFDKNRPSYELVYKRNDDGSYSGISITEKQFINLKIDDVSNTGTRDYWVKWMVRRITKGMQFNKCIEFNQKSREYENDNQKYYQFIMEYLRDIYNYSHIKKASEVEYYTYF